VEYRRFACAADAIRFAVEELPPKRLVGAYLEVKEQRFGRNGIRRLYDSADYPLARRAQEDEAATHEVLKADRAPAPDAKRTSGPKVQ